LGISVLGVDVAETALAIARAKADDRGMKIEFALADALQNSNPAVDGVSLPSSRTGFRRDFMKTAQQPGSRQLNGSKTQRKLF
jgi:hypothetical protein